MNPYAFFDVDSLELSPNGRIYVCHPRVSSISEELYEVYSIISGIAAPLIFSVDVNRNTPDKETNKRYDFFTLPISDNEDNWKASVADWYKFYVKRDASEDKEKVAIFNNNKTVAECIKLIKAKEWIVFGNGIEHCVDHVITTMLGFINVVKFVPDLIIPAENETKEQLDEYCQKWEKAGGIPMTYDDVINMARNHKY